MDRRLKVDDRPLYVQAVDALKLLIAEESYQPDDKLPPEGELAEQLGISRTTLRMALGHLELQGLISRRQGIGTFVSASPLTGLRGGLQTLTSVQALATSAGLRAETTDRQVSSVAATAERAQTLGVDEGSALSQVSCTISVGGRPIAHLHSVCPDDIVSAAELENGTGSLLEFLIERGEPVLSHTHSQIGAVKGGGTLAERLEITEGEALLHLVETYFSREGRPVALSLNYFASDRFVFFIRRQFSH